MVRTKRRVRDNKGIFERRIYQWLKDIDPMIRDSEMRIKTLDHQQRYHMPEYL